MDEKTIDTLLAKSLQKGTHSATHVKDQVWENIERRLSEDESEHDREKAGREMQRMTRVTANRTSRTSRKNSRTKKFITIAVVIGILLAASLTVYTETGQAYISKIREMFEPEKKVIEHIEGNPEKTNMQLHENESHAEREADYVIYVDQERYSVTKKDGVQRIEAKIDGNYPDVYMEITQVKDRKPDEIAKELRTQLAAEYADVTEVSEVTDPVKGYNFRALAGKEWNSEKIVYYVVSNGIEGSFVIKQAYFLEASEGHGARMYSMLRQFQVIVPGEVAK